MSLECKTELVARDESNYRRHGVTLHDSPHTRSMRTPRQRDTFGPGALRIAARRIPHFVDSGVILLMQPQVNSAGQSGSFTDQLTTVFSDALYQDIPADLVDILQQAASVLDAGAGLKPNEVEAWAARLADDVGDAGD